MERQARRTQVLRHAKRLFARKGYHRTNIADIIGRARIARGTFYLYFRNKRHLFGEILEEGLRQIGNRIERIRRGPDAPPAAEQLRNNLRRVLAYVLNERELTDILLNHSLDLDREIDEQILGFYNHIIALIQRSLELGVAMGMVRACDTRIVAAAILGGIKEVVAIALRERRNDVEVLAEEILQFGLCGVANPRLLEAGNYDRTGEILGSD